MWKPCLFYLLGFLVQVSVCSSVRFLFGGHLQQALHTVSSTDRDAVLVDQTTNTDGLLLAVDKFLSTGDSHHPLLSASRAVD